MAVVRNNLSSTTRLQNSPNVLVAGLVGVGLLLCLILFASTNRETYDSTGILSVSNLYGASSALAPPPLNDPMCLTMPRIRPDGVFFLKTSEIKQHDSHPLITPKFVVGSKLKGVSNHMGADLAHFSLLKDKFHYQEGSGSGGAGDGIAIDVGANQGFFTYYLSTLGVFDQVHAFEINYDNFFSLQHGRHYNPKEVSDRAYLYPVGLASSTQRLGMKGNLYEGYLAPDPNGSILSTTFDCFVYHTRLDLNKITFIKVDTEGFELSTLKGMKSTLPTLPNLKALLVEVGPSRWSRADTTLDDGLDLLKELLGSKVFQQSYVLIREKGAHSKTCPGDTPDGILADTNPKTFYQDETTISKMYKIQPQEWKPLFEKMISNNYDCNFWFENP